MHPHSFRSYVRRALLGLAACLLITDHWSSVAWGQQPKPEEVAAKARDNLRRDYPYSQAAITPAPMDRFKLQATALDEAERDAIIKSAMTELGLAEGDRDRLQANITLFKAKPEDIKSEYVIAEGELLILQSRTGLPVARVLVPRAGIIDVSIVPEEPAQVRVIGKASGTTPLTITDARGNVTVTTIRVERDLTDMREATRRRFPRANINIDPGSGQSIVVSGTVDNTEEIEPLLRFLAGYAGGAANVINLIRVEGVMQVSLEVCIAQVNRSEERRVGFDFFYQDPNLNSIFSNVSRIVSIQETDSTTFVLDPTKLTNIVSLSDNGHLFQGFIEALREEGLAKILANPTLTALNGRNASFLLGGEIPVIEATATGTPSITFKQFGTILNFVPVILGDGKIRLSVFAEISQPNFAQTVLGTPSFITTNTSTTVELENGQTMAIGGLMQSVVNANTTKTPILGDLPFVGTLFRRVFHEETETELVIIVTPRLVDALDCGQRTVKLPGQETRSPTDFELFLEGILEAPRGPREICPGGHYRASHAGDLTAHCGTVGPCGNGKGLTNGHPAHCNSSRPVAASAIPASHRMASQPAAGVQRAPVMQTVPPAPTFRVEYRQAEQPGLNGSVRPPEPPAELSMPEAPETPEAPEADEPEAPERDQ